MIIPTNVTHSKGRHYRIRFKVAYSTFPLDMLRYDSCHFVNEGEARDAESSIQGHSGEVQTAILETMIPDFAGWKPTVRRWESFGCQVVEIGEFE